MSANAASILPPQPADSPSSSSSSRPHFGNRPSPVTMIVFFGLLAIGLLFTGYSLVADVSETGARTTTYLPFILLGVALLIALGFEFVNGFHDTANAVATVIYTHSLPPNFAVV
jgi:PiT family inorganic phosphate transporter